MVTTKDNATDAGGGKHMPIVLVAYAFVEPGGKTPQALVRSVSSEIRQYLNEHADDLLGRARRGSSAPAFFRGPAAKKRMLDLQVGTQLTFLAAAQDLTVRLHTAMDQRSKRGFCVALQRSADSGVQECAFLKLDVREHPGAAARPVGGERLLEAIKDLLDLPGALQKGAVYPDPRGQSQVVVGDKVMVETAQYFLRAVEVQQIAGPGSATKTFIDTVAAVLPSKIDSIIEELDGYDRAVTPQEFLIDHGDLATDEERQRIVEQLEQHPRPVRLINPVERPPRVIVSADGISIRGTVDDMKEGPLGVARRGLADSD